MTALSGVDGLRLAEPGEFTRRAFENGRIDLTEAEGLADLIEAETESQRRAALLMAEGGLAKQIGEWQQRLLTLSARAEATIDYVDDDSVDSDPELSTKCAELAAELRQWLARPRSEPLREGVRVVIAGPPNAGKSSLLNAIAGFERSIVTDIPGTTRDHIEVPLSLSGLPVRLTDTAGLREASEEAEVLGIRKSREALAEADVVLVVLDASVPLRDDEATLLASLAGRRVIAVMNKCDLNLNGGAGSLLESPLSVQAVATSALTGDGIADLREALASLVRNPRGESESGMLTSIRHFEAVTGALEALRAAKAAVPAKTPHEMLLLDLYSGLRHLDSLTGETTADDILNRIFSSFCIGK